jgi:putative ABC transport system permease protein
MGLESRIRNVLRNLMNKPRAEAELDDELRAYVEMVTEEKVAAGLSPEEARRSTLAEFGGVEQVKQAVREERAGAGLELLGQDFRYGLRQLRKSRAFSLAAVLTLALGIGTTAAMFSVVDAVVLRPLPYNHVDRIVDVKTHSASSFWQVCSWPGYLEMRRENATFQDLAGYAPYWGMTLRVGDQAQTVRVTQGTDNFFHVFGVNSMLGRTFLPGEDTPGKNNIVVLSYETWRRAFNGNRNVVGTAVHLDGESYQVIGVMPAGFRFPLGEPNVVYIPMHVRPNWVAEWRDHWLLTVGLLKPGVNLQTAEADMSRVLANIGNQRPESDRGRTVQLMPITAALHGENELPEILVMLGAVLAVLLTACVNVAGLLMVRGLAREREMALRIAIGAAKLRIVRQLLVENILLGALGGAAGLLFAMGLLAAMKVFLAQAFLRGGNVQLNLPVVLAALGISVLSSIGAGLFPALRASNSDPIRALKSGVSAGTARSHNRLRASFVITQMALSLVLVVFSGLLLLTLRRMLQVDLGLNPKNLLMLGINIPSGDYGDRGYVQTLMTPLEERVTAIPGVVAAGIVDQPPVLGYGSGTTMQLVGQPPDPPDRERSSETRAATPGYYAAIGVPIVQGRGFSSLDIPSSQPTAIVNEAWVSEFLTNHEDPTSQVFLQPAGKPNIAIVGVVRNARQTLADPARPEIDFPFSDMTLEQQKDTGSLSVCLFIRTAVPPATIVGQLREALHEVAPAVAFQTPATMDDLLDDALVTNRMESWLFGIFAGISVVLAAVGVQGLLTQEVTSRTRDIGVRIAVGASRATIARMMLKRIAFLLAVGLGAGVGIVFLLHRVVASVVAVQFERDGVVIAALALLLGAIGLAAAIPPTRRAASIDPVQTLRME